MDHTQKKVKEVWLVVWTEAARPFYGVPAKDKIISVEPKEDIKFNISKTKTGRPKIRYAEPIAAFSEQIEAEAYREGNKDWKVVPATLTYTP